MQFTCENQGSTGTLRLAGRFTFETHPAFKSASRTLLQTPGLRRLVLDLEQVTHMDASSLGAMLLLREAAPAGTTIVLRKPAASVLTLLKIVKFDQLFELQV